MLPLLYHVHHADYVDDLPFWQMLARQQGDPVLELGCGTGRVLLHLYHQSIHMYGLDFCLEMLACLRSLACENPPPIFQADMCSFCLGQLFPLILLPCNTFSMLSSGERQATLSCVRRHLCRGGLFAVSLPNPSVLAQLPRHSEPEIEKIIPHPIDGEPVQIITSWQRTDNIIAFHWMYDHLLADGHVERFSSQVIHTLQPLDAYLAEFKVAGLHVKAIYGDFDRLPYSEETPHLIFLASKDIPETYQET